jgi:glycine/D-amino acid oxidase-like deaminating enzyme
MAERVDIVVIGGGAIGVSVAYFVKLIDPGADIVVLERDPAYSLASTPRASGGVRRLFSLPENIALSAYSIEFFQGLGPDVSFRRNGYLFIVPPESRGMLRRNFDVQQGQGCRVEWLAPEEIKNRYRSMRVDDLGAAVFSPDDGWLDPHGVLMSLKSRARSLGVRFLAGEAVGFDRTGSTITAVRLAGGPQIEAAQYVNAAGAWARDICAMLDLPVPIEPLRRYEHYFECQEPIEPLPYLKDTRKLAFRPEGTGYSGGVPSLDEPRGYRFDTDSGYFDRVVSPALAHRFPQFERTRCLRTLPGLYDQNDFDGNVIIGPSPDGPANFHLLSGFSGHGLMHAPSCGRAMAELLLTGGYQTIDLTRFGWWRVSAGMPLREEGII